MDLLSTYCEFEPNTTEDLPCRGAKAHYCRVDRGCGWVQIPGSNPEEGMDVCNCIGPVRNEGTINIRQATSSLERLAEGEDGWMILSNILGCFSSKLKEGAGRSHVKLPR
ncbi:hypothetical protein TNCV_4925191 [Trichonephila clavipes]|nr:hypothetical protein TNCV_4925191 [Trichonephila clavipes]